MPNHNFKKNFLKFDDAYWTQQTVIHLVNECIAADFTTKKAR